MIIFIFRRLNLMKRKRDIHIGVMDLGGVRRKLNLIDFILELVNRKECIPPLLESEQSYPQQKKCLCLRRVCEE